MAGPLAHMHMQNNRRRYLWIILGAIALSIAISYFLKNSFGIFENREGLEMFISQFGKLAPIVTILIIVLEVVIAPLPGGIAPVIAGFLFGPLLGIFYAWIGSVLGSVIAFWIARKFGARVILYFAPNFNHERYQQTVTTNNYFFLLLYACPFTPVDILSFAFGISNISFRRFLSLISVAFFLRMAFWVSLGGIVANALFIN